MTKNAPTRLIALRGTMFFFFFQPVLITYMYVYLGLNVLL